MSANNLKENLSINDVFSLLEELNANPHRREDIIISRTVCHCGEKHKLYYYNESKSFRCYTECSESFDIYGLIKKVKGFEFKEAFDFLKKRFNYTNTTIIKEDKDRYFWRKFKRKEDTLIMPCLDKLLLENFYDMYFSGWIEEGITIETMQKFDIKMSILDKGIIIPHFDKVGTLLGIRKRALDEEEVAAGRKYVPIYHQGRLLNHPTGANLYGLNVNLEQIEKHKTIILFESEKSVLQLNSFLPDFSVGVCVSGSSLTSRQVDILKTLDIENVIIGMDKEYEESYTDQEFYFSMKVKKALVDKLSNYFNVSTLWDRKGLLDYKDSPTDKGRDVFVELLNERIFEERESHH